MARGGFLDAAYEILKGAGHPMHGMEIVRIGLDRNLFTTSAKDHRTLVNSLYSEVQRSRNRRGFVVLGNGHFGLREWDSGSQQLTPRSVGQRRTRAPSARTSSQAESISLEMLELTRQSMPADQFRQIWGALYDQLLVEERAKAITPLNDKELASRVRKLVQRIQDFLQGRGNQTPQSEEICDWINLCYALELYREATALWQYVHQDEVNGWHFDRTKKVAAVCRVKTGL